MEELTLFLSLLLGFSLVFYMLVTHLKSYGELKAIKRAKRVLCVISHPDDESMFFGPTILGLNKQPDTSVFLLCLSMGNYRQQGLVRKKELYKACDILGIPEENITILKYTKLSDDPDVRWREELLSNVILHYVIANDFDVVVTFDRAGVSGHKNHTSVFNALALLCMSSKMPKSIRVFCLRTVNVLRKYSSLFDVPMSFMLAPTAYIASYTDWLKIRRAMCEGHRSQYVWFRKLYMIFSRYVLVNTFDQINSRAEKRS